MSKGAVTTARYAALTMATAHINPAMLRWAMDRVGVSEDAVAQAFRKPREAIEGWLAGDSAPTFKQAQSLARRLRVPFGYLFLGAPPDEALPLPDFRRTVGTELQGASVDLRDVIADVLRKQDWYRDFRLDNDEEPMPFVGAFASSSSVTDVAADIAERLDFESAVRPQSQASQFLRSFVGQVEKLGILVMRNGIVRQSTNRALDVEEFRGFSIADPMAPVIFVNNADSNAAQAFTLAHELAHVWIGRGGISDADPTIEGEGAGDIEEYCNEVAAELLLPWSRLATRWSQRASTIPGWISEIAREFHVSTVMVARQLWEHTVIERDEFFSLYEAEKANWLRPESEGSGGNYYLSVPIRNSRLLTAALLDSVRAAETSIRDASRLLGVKPANLPKLQESMGVSS